MTRPIKWIYVVTNAEPDVELNSVWESERDAEARRAELHERWPGMGYFVQTIGLHPPSEASS